MRLLEDLKHALRVFRTSPVFAVTAVAAIALGIGATTAIFSVVNAVVLKPVPFPEPDRIVQLQILRDGAAFGTSVSPTKFMVWRDLRGEVFSDLAGFMTGVPLTINQADVPEVVSGGRVSEGFFRVFGAPIARGRGFTPDEDLPGAAPVVVLSHAFWRDRLAADPDIVGKAVSLGGAEFTVVGVVREGFDLRELGDPEFFVPLQLDPASTEQAHTFRAAARLAPDVTLAQARARMAATLATFNERFPAAVRAGESFTVLSLREALVGDTSRTLWVLLGAVGFVLLIACANVASLMLIRGSRRKREIGVRSALGAGRARIVQQLLTEALLLAGVGGALGVAAGFVAIRALLAIDTAGLPRLGDATWLGLDWRVVTFAVAVSLGTGLLFGLMPALATARVDLNAVLKSAGNRSGHDRRDGRTRSALVVAEIGLAVVLLIGAALLIRTSLALGSVEPGFDAHNVLLLRTSLSGTAYASTASVEQAIRAGRERLLATPGVVEAGSGCCVPTRFSSNLPFNAVGRDIPEGQFTGAADFAISSPGYFATFRIPLRGRDFTDADTGGAPGAVIVNEAFARRFWPDGDALGARIWIGGGRMDLLGLLGDEPEREIVGIAGDVRNRSLDAEPNPTMYVPQAQLSDVFNAFYMGNVPVVWTVRTAGAPEGIIRALDSELRQVTGVPVIDTETMEQVVSLATARERFNMLLMSIFGSTALVLAALGIYGLLAYSVEQRTQELGVRVALGAEPYQIRGIVLRQGGVLVCAGVAGGLVAAFYLSNLLASFLFGVEARDAAVFIAVPVVLSLIGLGTVAVVARRAGRVDPLESLRHD
jgi:predicted permease